MSPIELDGMLHGLGSPATGERVRVRLDAHGVTILYPGGRTRGIPFAGLRSRVGGWKGQALLLEWEEQGGPATLALNDEHELARVTGQMADLPAGLRPHLQVWQRTQRRQRAQRRGLLIGGGLVMVALLALLLALLLRAGKLTEMAVARIPPEVEQQIGDLALKQVSLGMRELPAGPATVAVDSIMQRLLPHVQAPYAFRWKVVDMEQANAFAVPGGGIVVFSGLLRQADNADEVAGVLAHEIQHVVQRHSLRAMVQSLGLAAIVDLAVGGGSQMAGQVAGVAQQLGQLRFSRTQEAQADEGALALLQQAGIRADGLVAFFRRLGEDGKAVPAWLSTHPDSHARATRIEALAAAGSASPAPLPIDWQAVRAGLAEHAAAAPASTEP